MNKLFSHTRMFYPYKSMKQYSKSNDFIFLSHKKIYFYHKPYSTLDCYTQTKRIISIAVIHVYMYKVRLRPAFATVSVKTQPFASHITHILYNNEQIVNIV